jgi:hypothetical protein
VRHGARTTRRSAGGWVRVGRLRGCFLIAELFRTHGEQLDETSGWTVGLHQLAGARESERSLQLAIDFGEKQWTAGELPVVEGGKPGERFFVVAGCES